MSGALPPEPGGHSPAEAPPLFVCPEQQCTAGFAVQERLLEHVRTHHPSSGWQFNGGVLMHCPSPSPGPASPAPATPAVAERSLLEYAPPSLSPASPRPLLLGSRPRSPLQPSPRPSPPASPRPSLGSQPQGEPPPPPPPRPRPSAVALSRKHGPQGPPSLPEPATKRVNAGSPSSSPAFTGLATRMNVAPLRLADVYAVRGLARAGAAVCSRAGERCLAVATAMRAMTTAGGHAPTQATPSLPSVPQSPGGCAHSAPRRSTRLSPPQSHATIPGARRALLTTTLRQGHAEINILARGEGASFTWRDETPARQHALPSRTSVAEPTSVPPNMNPSSWPTCQAASATRASPLTVRPGPGGRTVQQRGTVPAPLAATSSPLAPVDPRMFRRTQDVPARAYIRPSGDTRAVGPTPPRYQPTLPTSAPPAPAPPAPRPPAVPPPPMRASAAAQPALGGPAPPASASCPHRGRARGTSSARGRGQGLRTCAARSRSGTARAAVQRQPARQPARRIDIPQTVPSIIRAQWGRVYARALLDVVDAVTRADDPQASAEVCAALDALADLPRRALADNRGSHGRNRRALARMVRIEAGQALEDEDDDDATDEREAAVPRLRRRTLSAEQLMALRVERMLGLGSVTRSARVLASAPLADTRSPAVIAALHGKHPFAEPPVPLEDTTSPLRIDAELLERALKRLDAKLGSAGGPTGMTYEHVLAATKASSEAFNATLAFVNLMLTGRLPRHSSLLDSSLVGIQKPDGGTRPIAIGEVLYRLTGLCAMTACEELGRSLAPLQLAVGVSGGVEALVHAVRSALAADSDTALLTVDMANAFNEVDRSALFTAVQKYVPALLPYVQWSYGAPTDLHIVGAPAGTAPIQSRTGVRQGDTLAMLLFALVVQQILERTQATGPAVAVLAIADDVNLVGKVDALREAFHTLTGDRGMPSVGLRVQPRKCALTAGPSMAVASLAADLGIRHCPNGVTVCGTPVGTDAYIAAALSARADVIIEQAGKLMALPVSHQAQFALLRSSLSMRMAHLLRTVAWDRLQPSVMRVEDAIMAAAKTLFQVPEVGAASARAVQQLRLPLRHGGFGLRDATPLVAAAALVAGASKAQAAMQNGPAVCQPFSGALRPALLSAWQRVYDDAAGECEWEESARDLPAEFVLEALPGVQKAVSRVVGDRAGADMLEACDTNTVEGQRDAARLRSASTGTSSGWLTALPMWSALRLTNAEFRMAARHRLGLGVPSLIDIPPCTCSTGDSTTPDHALSCKHNAGKAIVRHDIWASAWRHAIRRAGCASSAEPLYSSLVAPGAQGAATQRRGDILVVWPDGGVRILDCVITHPAAASYVRDAAEAGGSAAAKAEARKRADFAEVGEGSAFDFVPLAVESYGRMGVAASRFLSELGDLVEAAGRVSKAAFVRTVRRELSCALCKGNACMYYNSLSRIAVRVGHNFRPGCDEPMEGPDDARLP